VAAFHHYTVNTLSTHFVFTLPLDAAANFRTELISVRWLLSFKIISDVRADTNSQQWTMLPAPGNTHAEDLTWDLPLQVLPHGDQEAVRQRVCKTVLLSPTSFV
jgi:hypothetical protein